MANTTTDLDTFPNSILINLFSVVCKFIAMIIGVLGNSVTIYTVFLSKGKTTTAYLMGNLALADLLVCLTLYPMWIAEFIQIVLNIDNDHDLFCKFSRATMWAFMFASIATLLAITVDRYLYIVKPMRYPRIVTHRRVFLAVSGIWMTAWCLFTVHYINDKRSKSDYRSFCKIPCIVNYFTNAFAAYIPLTFIFLLNFRILSVARKQRKRILAETTISSVDDSAEESPRRKMSFVRGFFVALKTAKTFAIIFVVLIVCILVPSTVGQILDYTCNTRCQQIWYVLFHFELYGINSVVNAFIYGMRHVKYRKAYLHILYKLFFCHKATNS